MELIIRFSLEGTTNAFPLFSHWDLYVPPTLILPFKIQGFDIQPALSWAPSNWHISADPFPHFSNWTIVHSDGLPRDTCPSCLGPHTSSSHSILTVPLLLSSLVSADLWVHFLFLTTFPAIIVAKCFDCFISLHSLLETLPKEFLPLWYTYCIFPSSPFAPDPSHFTQWDLFPGSLEFLPSHCSSNLEYLSTCHCSNRNP